MQGDHLLIKGIDADSVNLLNLIALRGDEIAHQFGGKQVGQGAAGGDVTKSVHALGEASGQALSTFPLREEMGVGLAGRGQLQRGANAVEPRGNDARHGDVHIGQGVQGLELDVGAVQGEPQRGLLVGYAPHLVHADPALRLQTGVAGGAGVGEEGEPRQSLQNARDKLLGDGGHSDVVVVQLVGQGEMVVQTEVDMAAGAGGVGVLGDEGGVQIMVHGDGTHNLSGQDEVVDGGEQVLVLEDDFKVPRGALGVHHEDRDVGVLQGGDDVIQNRGGVIDEREEGVGGSGADGLECVRVGGIAAQQDELHLKAGAHGEVVGAQLLDGGAQELAGAAGPRAAVAVVQVGDGEAVVGVGGEGDDARGGEGGLLGDGQPLVRREGQHVELALGGEIRAGRDGALGA